MMKKEVAETDRCSRSRGTSDRARSSSSNPNTGRQPVIYEKNQDYVPRSEPAAHRRRQARVPRSRDLEIMPDAQTAAAALMAGEIEFYEVPPIDILPALQAAPGSRSRC